MQCHCHRDSDINNITTALGQEHGPSLYFQTNK